jgi:transcription elongation factor GreA
MSEEIRQKIQDELRLLETELRTEIPAELKRAVAMGDLSENAEYESARSRQDFVRARIANLRKRIADISMLDTSRLPRDRVAYGSTVQLYDLDSGEEFNYSLVMAEDSDASQNKISTTSPIGRGLMGKSEGDEVEIITPAGKRRFEIARLTTIHDKAD